jgi:hypothetical protein
MQVDQEELGDQDQVEVLEEEVIRKEGQVPVGVEKDVVKVKNKGKKKTIFVEKNSTRIKRMDVGTHNVGYFT